MKREGILYELSKMIVCSQAIHRRFKRNTSSAKAEDVQRDDGNELPHYEPKVSVIHPKPVSVERNMDIIKDLWNNFYNWVKQEPLTAGTIGSMLATFILAIVFQLPARIIKWLRLRRKIAFSEKFPFERVKPEEFGQWLLDKRKLTCYKNPFVPVGSVGKQFRRWNVIRVSCRLSRF